MSDEPLRLSKLMALRGLCSRREADEYISRGLVYVDGKKIDVLGTKVLPHQTITLKEEAQKQQASLKTIILHKPVGWVSGQPEDGYPPAIELVIEANRSRLFPGEPFRPEFLRGIAPAGRLDIDSTGLLVFTQDGRIAKLLTGEGTKVPKQYLVRVTGRLDPRGLQLLNHGLSLDGEKLRPSQVRWQNEDQLHFTLWEGKKRQIRRMCVAVGLQVVGLKRTFIGQIALGRLELGTWRYLQPNESF